MLGAPFRSLNETRRLIAPPTNAVLAPDSAWAVPLARVPGIDALVEWPHWLLAAAGAALIAATTRRLAFALPAWAAGLALVGWSLEMGERDLVPGCAVLGISLLIGRSVSWKRLPTAAALTAALVACVLVTVEFGFLLLWAGMLLLADACAGRESGTRSSEPRGGLRTRWGGWLLPLPVGLVALAGGLCPGFWPAMLRPLSWSWIEADVDLLPSLGHVFASGSWLGGQCLLVLFVLAAWGLAFRRGAGIGEVVPLLVLTLIGLGCSHFLWLGTLAIALLAKPARLSWQPSRAGRLVPAGLLLFACARLTINLPLWSDHPWQAATNPRMVNATSWGTHGPVLLMDLEQSPDWQTGRYRRLFPLLVDDRWDIFGGFYETYAAVCRDLDAVRSHSYFRTDGEWGGYTRWLRKWSPALIVADSAETRRIRRLSLGPDWSVMGVDARRTIFGLTDREDNAPQRRRSLETLMRWEWPGRVPPAADGTVVAAETGDERRRVAGVLCAMRLPYAALRMLPPTDDVPDTLKTWCYAEIAHRVRRHSGRASLLDQPRAVRRFLRGREKGAWSAEESLRIAYSLEGLGLPRLSERFARDVLDGWGPFAASAEQRRQAQALRERRHDEPESSPPVQPASGTDEMQVRRALITGEESVSPQIWDELAPPVRDYYSVFFSAGHRPAETLSEDLIDVLDSSNFPERLRGEAWFYLGCLAIELGDPAGAIQVLSESARVDPDSAYRPLRTMYLKQLSQHARR